MLRNDKTITFENQAEINSIQLVLKQYELDHPDRPIIAAKKLECELSTLSILFEG